MVVTGGHYVSASYPISGPSQEEVFAALLEVWRFPEWACGLERVSILGGGREVRPGTALSFALNAAGIRHEVESTITVVDPPRTLQWRYTRGASGTGGLAVDRESAGSVRVTFTTNYVVEPRWLDRIAARPFFRRAADDLLRRSLRRLGSYLSSGGSFQRSSSP
ncbi:MAG: SRPBCC family protein [Rubrobacteraceae bacterium]|nr:SRPBCC family protein [Rubrobacteraceae bacterium]MCL6438781.1 SRPBCC family protein [Rubrobacteraceae bacterium]